MSMMFGIPWKFSASVIANPGVMSATDVTDNPFVGLSVMTLCVKKTGIYVRS